MNWHYLTPEQTNIGPINDRELAALIASGVVTQTTLVWNESLDGWIKASESDAANYFGDTSPPPPPPSKEVRHKIDASKPTSRLRAWWLWTIVCAAGVVLLELGLILHYSAEQTGWIADSVRSSAIVKRALKDGVSGTFAIHMLGNLCVLAAAPLLLAFLIFHCLILYRSWKTLTKSERRLHPAAVIALLFLPIFNFYWVFRAYWGLARMCNRSTNPVARGRLSETIFLLFCVSLLVSVLVPPLNMYVFPVAALAGYVVTMQLARLSLTCGAQN